MRRPGAVLSGCLRLRQLAAHRDDPGRVLQRLRVADWQTPSCRRTLRSEALSEESVVTDVAIVELDFPSYFAGEVEAAGKAPRAEGSGFPRADRPSVRFGSVRRKSRNLPKRLSGS